MKRLNLGVIGCGIAARKLHLPALRKVSSRFRVGMVCNRTAPKAESFAELVGGAPWTTDYHELLDNPGIDAVLIILPVELNLAVTRAALAAEKHVLVEKPLAINAKECRAMIGVAARSSCVSMVAENFRYRPTLRKVKALIEENAFGRVYAVQWSAANDVAPETSPYARTTWRINHQYPGGYPMDGGVHWANGIRYLFGEVTRVSSWTTQVNPVLGDVDTHFMEFMTNAGIHGVYTHNFSAKGLYEDRLMIFGSDATGIIEKGSITMKRRGRKDKVIAMKDEGGYAEQLVAFHSAITRGSPVETSFEEGFRDFRLIERSLHSAKTGRPVSIR